MNNTLGRLQEQRTLVYAGVQPVDHHVDDLGNLPEISYIPPKLSFDARYLIKLLKIRPVRLADFIVVTSRASEFHAVIDECRAHGYLIHATTDDHAVVAYNLHGRSQHARHHAKNA